MARTKRNATKEKKEESVSTVSGESAVESAEKSSGESAVESAEKSSGESIVESVEKTTKEENTAETNIKKELAFEDIYEELKSDSIVGPVLSVLKRYIDTVFGRVSPNGQVIAAKNYELYKLLISVVTEKDYAKFKAKYDVINKIFLVEKYGRFSPITLSRYDFYWTYGLDTRMKYASLIEIISELSDPTTRIKNKKKLSLDNITKILPANAVENIVRYYNL